jgi:hypothetical protein
VKQLSKPKSEPKRTGILPGNGQHAAPALMVGGLDLHGAIAQATRLFSLDTRRMHALKSPAEIGYNPSHSIFHKVAAG